MTSPSPKPILSDFDRMFEEHFPNPADAMARRSVEHVAAGDRKQTPRPEARQS